MKKVLMMRPGSALGDAVFVTPIPRILAERGEEVHVCCEADVRPVFENNPHIAGFIECPKPHKWDGWEAKYRELETQFDHIYHTHGHVEVGLLHRTDVCWGKVPNAHQRKEVAAGKNYQDSIFESIGLEERGLLPEFYFSDAENKMRFELRQLLDKDKKKLVVWQWDGSTLSKLLVWAPKWLRETMNYYSDTVHYVYAEDANLKAQIPADERVLDALGKFSVRESIMATSIADLVIGPESFIVNAAAAWPIHKILFLSHSAPENLAKYYINCDCITPNAEVTCHPCYLIQIDFQRVYDPVKRGICREFVRNCNVWDADFVYRSLGYKCCYFLPHNQVAASIKKALG
jgi:hypothetical protein